MSSLDEESLRKLSYSELKKQAKKNGVKVSMTADKIIASLLEKSNADEDSFVTLERTILNSCKKNKEALFERDSKRMSETPRRDTYTVDTPLTGKKVINTSSVMASASPELKESKDDSLNVTLSRGSEKKGRKSKRKVSFVTPLRRSTRLSAATPQYNSVKGRPKTPMPSRLSTSAKRTVAKEVNDSVALSLDLDLSGNLDSKKSGVGKVKRPSTPVPSKQSKKRINSFGHPECFELSPRVILHRLKEEDLKDVFPIDATPSHQPIIEETKACTPYATQKKAAITPEPTSNKAAALAQGFKKIVNPFSASGKHTSICSSTPRNRAKTPQASSKTCALTPGFKKIVTPFSSSKMATTPKSLMKTSVTAALASSAIRRSPRSNVRVATPKLTSSGVKKTPNFNKLHQRAFEKMESISDYHQRKLLNSEKKKEEQNKLLNASKKRASLEKLRRAQKVFGGIPFIPSAAATKPVKPSLKLRSETKMASSAPTKAVGGKCKIKKATAGSARAIKSASRENTPLRQRHKFDLRASLAKKLPYKPHTGPLKPLNEINLNNTMAKTPLTASKKETNNPVVSKARIQTREVLHGVRKNKRFMLQMNNRNLNMSVQ